MRVFFVTSEVAGLFKLGGLGDVSFSLPAALHKLGVDIAVALPYYASMKTKHATCIGPIAVSFDGQRELVFVFATKIPGTGVPLFLFRHPLLDEYQWQGTDPDLPIRFAFFSQVVATFLTVSALQGVSYEIVHCNDWHTALVPLLLGESRKTFLRYANNSSISEDTIQSKSIKTILTIHNPVYHGTVRATLVRMIALDRRQFHILNDGQEPKVNLLREGLEYADVITTVSPTFAKEIVRHDYGPHVSGVLKRRRDRIVGILNGIDAGIWNPRTDPFLPYHYGVQTVHTVKTTIKTYLQQTLRLAQSSVPVFGFVGRLDERQKGIDILLLAAERLLGSNTPVQFAILGTGKPRVVRTIELLQKKYLHTFSFTHTFDERLARRIYAGSDVILVPSKYEPCGLTQMIGMRYGTIPLVRKTGGLADTVIDGKTGFVFGPYTASALESAMHRAIMTWSDQRTWHRMIENVMRQDYSWRKSAQDYVNLYTRLIKK